MFSRRISSTPTPQTGNSSGANGCPDIWELKNGDFAIIGFRPTLELRNALPDDAGIEPDEDMVVIPRNVLLSTRKALNLLPE